MATVVSRWKPMYRDDWAQVETTDLSTEEALLQGKRLSCLNGVRMIAVFDDNDLLIAVLSRDDNHWHEYRETYHE